MRHYNETIQSAVQIWEHLYFMKDSVMVTWLTVSLYLTLSFSDWVSRSAGLIQGVILGRQR